MKKPNNSSSVDGGEKYFLDTKMLEGLSESAMKELLESSLLDITPEPVPDSNTKHGDVKVSSARRREESEENKPWNMRHSTPVSNRNRAALAEVERKLSDLSPIRGCGKPSSKGKVYVEKSTSTRDREVKVPTSAGNRAAKVPTSSRKRESERKAVAKTPEENIPTSNKQRDGKRSLVRQYKDGGSNARGKYNCEKTKPNESTDRPKKSHAKKSAREHEGERSRSNKKVDAEESRSEGHKERAHRRGDTGVVEERRKDTPDMIPKRDVFGLPVAHGDIHGEMEDQMFIEGSDEMVKTYEKVCENKKLILNNETEILNQEKDLDQLMILSDILSDGVSKKSKHLEEITKVYDFLKTEEQKHRVTVKSDLIGAQMYSVNADKVQEDIWKIREEVAALDYIRGFENSTVFYMHADHLKKRLVEEQNENKELERKIELLDKGISGTTEGIGDSTSKATTSRESSKIMVEKDKDRFVVRPQIHRRHPSYNLNFNNVQGGNPPVTHKINPIEPLPSIVKQEVKVVSPEKHKDVKVKKESKVKMQSKEKLLPIEKKSLKPASPKEICQQEKNEHVSTLDPDVVPNNDVKSNLVVNMKKDESWTIVIRNHDRGKADIGDGKMKTDTALKLKAKDSLPAIKPHTIITATGLTSTSVPEDIVRVVEINMTDSLPPIGDKKKEHKSVQTRTDSLPPIGNCANKTKETEKLKEHKAVQTRTESLPPLTNVTECDKIIPTDKGRQTSSTYFSESSRFPSPFGSDYESESLYFTPTPPSTARSTKGFTRKNVMAKLKSFFGK